MQNRSADHEAINVEFSVASESRSAAEATSRPVDTALKQGELWLLKGQLCDKTVIVMRRSHRRRLEIRGN